MDITSGKFVFGCTEAYMIEDGKIGAPVTGASLIGRVRSSAYSNFWRTRFSWSPQRLTETTLCYCPTMPDLPQ
jgi:hypothetical protein